MEYFTGEGANKEQGRKRNVLWAFDVSESPVKSASYIQEKGGGNKGRP